MWIYLSIASAVLLGIYDVAKKATVKRNSVMWVLFSTSAMSAAMMLPMYQSGTPAQFAMLLPKMLFVSLSWISGLEAMKLLPLTIASTLKASRPVFVVLFSIILFGERLNLWQSVGVVTALTALWLLSRTSRREGIEFRSNKGILWMVLSIVTGVASALYDKHIMKGLQADFVQSWSTLLITLFMGAVLLVQQMRRPSGEREQFRWDWNLLLVSVSILFADMAYFHALKDPDALLSIVSLIRRGAAIVSFILAALIFREGNVRGKAAAMALLLAGITIMAWAS